jgi:hypothetical protein
VNETAFRRRAGGRMAGITMISLLPIWSASPSLSRRQLMGAGIAPLLVPLASTAATPTRDAAICSLWDAEKQLVRCNRLIASGPSLEQLREAASIMGTRELDETNFAALFDVITAKPSATEKAMNSAAFIVYYEEKRYGDTRLEPQTPGMRAQQNGFRRDVLRNVDDLKAELKLLVGRGADLDGEDLDDLQRYSDAASRALRSYLALSEK